MHGQWSQKMCTSLFQNQFDGLHLHQGQLPKGLLCAFKCNRGGDNQVSEPIPNPKKRIQNTAYSWAHHESWGLEVSGI